MGNFFTDVICPDPRFNSVDRISDPLLLEPVTRQAVQNIIRASAAQGITLIAFETYRSQNRQAALFAQGATKLQHVGVHHYGLACDLVVLVGGETSWKPSYAFLGPLAAAEGLVWGGDWGTPQLPHSFRDFDHVQRCTIAQQDGLFSGSWYPDSPLAPAGTIVA